MKLGQWLVRILILGCGTTLVPALRKTKVAAHIPVMHTTPLLSATQGLSDQRSSSYGAVGESALSQEQLDGLLAIVEDVSELNSSRDPHTQEVSAEPQAHDDPLVEQCDPLPRFALGDTPVPPASTSAPTSGTHTALASHFAQTRLAQTRLAQSRLLASKTDFSLGRLELRRGSSGDLEVPRRSRQPQQAQEVVGGPLQETSGSQGHKHKHQRSQSCGDLDFIAQQLQQEIPQASGGIGLVAAPMRPSPELQRAGSGACAPKEVQVKSQALVQATPETGFLGRERVSLWKKIRGPLLLCSVLSVIGLGHGLLNNSLSKGEWNQHFYATSWLEWELGAGFNVFAMLVAAALHYKLQVFKSMSPMAQQLLGIPLAAASCSAGQLLGEMVPLHGGWRNGAVNLGAAGIGAWYVGQVLRFAWTPSHLPPAIRVNHELHEEQGEGL